MSCPLYKSLKKSGTTFYAFPSAAEDMSAAFQNSNNKTYFSKYVLLNLPKQNLNPGSATSSKPVYFDFENSFKTSINANTSASYQEQIVESLRNYVANHEVVIKESRLNNTNYYYDNNALETTTEKIFYKWSKKLNIIDFEPAIPDDEYFSNLGEFESNSTNDEQYFPEYLWKEREVISWDTKLFYESSNIISMLEVEFYGTTNFKVNDVVKLYNVDILDASLSGIETDKGINVKVLAVIKADENFGQRVIFDINASNLPLSSEAQLVSGKAELVYNRLVQYIGEVNGISNVQEANRSYTEVYAHIPDHTGKTPDILFRTTSDINYKPNLSFPIIPSQYQPEIMGAESFKSPIVNTPYNYPGSYLGQFDTLDFTYETSNGDSVRRSGSYYGVKGDINNPIVDGSTIDGISLDFNSNHYVKMNILGRNLTNFDQFNALSVNNQPPIAFEFNAILWYYTVEDNEGNARNNLYGISFLDNPDNNVLTDEIGLRFPTVKKFVTNGLQDGTAYAFSLNLNYNIINENPQDTYNPEAINSTFSMNLFNKAMSKLASTNDSFINLIAEQGNVREEVQSLKSLLYTQTDLATINAKIQNLERLLRLYSTNQIISSESIEVNMISGTPPNISLTSINKNYENIYNYRSSDMYNSQGIIPINLSVPKNRDFLIYFTNDDEVELTLPIDKLTFVLDKDLSYKQSVEFIIKGGEFCTQNKKMDIYMNSDISNVTNQVTEVLLIGDIDLPVYFNETLQQQNSAYLWKDFKFNINLNKPILLNVGSKLEVPIDSSQILLSNSIKQGDTIYLNNLFVGTSSVYNFSGQYTVQSIATDSYLILDISSNENLVSYGSSASFPLDMTNMLANIPYFSLNKGKKVKVSRVSNSLILRERYSIDIEDIQ